MIIPVKLFDGISADDKDAQLQILGQSMISIQSREWGSKIFKLKSFEVTHGNGKVYLIGNNIQIEMDEVFFSSLNYKKDHTTDIQLVGKLLGYASLIVFTIYLFRLPLYQLLATHVARPLIELEGKRMKNTLAPLNCMSKDQKDVLNTLAIRMGLNPDQYTIMMMKDSTVNAFALPGEIIILNDGLLKKVTPEGLAGILAHEVAHLEKKHLERKIIKDSMVQIIFTLALNQKDSGIISEFTKGYFTQSDEREADEVSAQLLKEQKISPKGVSEFFQNLKEEHGTMDKFILSHPPYNERIGLFSSNYETLPVLGQKDWTILAQGCPSK